jgi:hypothetical protein
MHQRTECGFASVAQLLSFFAAGSGGDHQQRNRSRAGQMAKDPAGAGS